MSLPWYSCPHFRRMMTSLSTLGFGLDFLQEVGGLVGGGRVGFAYRACSIGRGLMGVNCAIVRRGFGMCKRGEESLRRSLFFRREGCVSGLGLEY